MSDRDLREREWRGGRNHSCALVHTKLCDSVLFAQLHSFYFMVATVCVEPLHCSLWLRQHQLGHCFVFWGEAFPEVHPSPTIRCPALQWLPLLYILKILKERERSLLPNLCVWNVYYKPPIPTCWSDQFNWSVRAECLCVWWEEAIWRGKRRPLERLPFGHRALLEKGLPSK